ncbi:LPS export ABC transporter permease LptF [Moraxella osloensis]|uniref:Lipopolysaccharide export system permease protein LptF n=1 Tax=Faucicola osloensis TaxID=34062 RepID=A0AAW6TD75_FAUOS|nr:LPS export ABC transporter permease LptF [Moraxella osloensis]MDI4510416.1 LPS export ABC transporter permease LptF [Moraxella osloensis]
MSNIRWLLVILRRYMTQQVAANTAIVLLFLMALMLGGRLIRYFGIAAEGRLDVGLLFAIIGYNIPTFLELILPLSFFIALMLVLGRMYVDQEMSVLFASGISRGRLTRLMIPLITGLFVFQMGISLLAKPWGLSNSKQIWQTQSLGSLLDLVRPKTFISSGNYHLYVDEFDKEKRELKNLYVVQQQTDKSGKIAKNDVIITATRAYQVPSKDTDSSMQLDLFQGRRYELGTNNAKYNQASFEKYRITLEKPASEKITETNVETQTTAKLLAHTQKPEVKAELGYRFTMPWLIIIAAMLATPLAQVRPRQGRWLRLLPSVLIFASCAISIISLRTAIGKERISEYAYIWLIVGFIVFALLLNWQSRVVHRVRYRRHSRQLSAGGQP